MTEAVQRSAGDIDLWTRSFAEEQARQAGVPIRAWLDDFIARAALPPEVQLASNGVDDGAAADLANAWGPARDAFGQRASRPAAPQSVEAGQVSAAAILARAVDDTDFRGPAAAKLAEDHACGADRTDELGVRVRVSRAQASERRRLDIDDVERLLGGSGPHSGEIDTQAPLSDVERALREMREQMDAALQLTETTAPAAPCQSGNAASPGEQSTEAIANLGSDIARLVEVMDCGFDRIEAAGAQQTLELRGEVARMFDELATRIDAFERQSAATDGGFAQVVAPDADPAEAAAPHADEEASQALASPELEDGLAPILESSGGQWHDDDADEPPTWSAAAAPVLPTTDVDSEPPAASALYVPSLPVGDVGPGIAGTADPFDAELFEYPRAPDASEGAEPPRVAAAEPVELPDWSEPAFPALPAPGAADQSWRAAADDDPDAELFVEPSASAGDGAAHDEVVDEAHADPVDWRTSEAAAPALPDPAANEVWFGPRSSEAPSQPVSDWRAATGRSNGVGAPTDPEPPPELSAAAPHAPDDPSAERFDPFEPSVGQVAELTPDPPAKRSAFPWLTLRRAQTGRRA